jgi:hypothetical protein
LQQKVPRRRIFAIFVGVPDGEGFLRVDVVFIVKIVLHVWACWVEKKGWLEKGQGWWLVRNGAAYFQHGTRLE